MDEVDDSIEGAIVGILDGGSDRVVEGVTDWETNGEEPRGKVEYLTLGAVDADNSEAIEGTLDRGSEGLVEDAA